MKLFIAILVLTITMNPILLFDFTKNTNPKTWKVIDDVVMGGQSNGSFTIDKDGNGVFSGEVSLENNGGFSSIRYQCDPVKVTKNSKVHIRLKGDGKDYQFRIKDKSNSYYSYITTFKTSGDWQTVSINLSVLYPSFRGRKLDMPNFSSTSFEEIVFLIANKKNESFQLVLDQIELE